MRSSLKRLFKSLLIALMSLVAMEGRSRAEVFPKIAGQIGGEAGGLVEQNGLAYWLMGPTLLAGRFDETTGHVAIVGRSPLLRNMPKAVAVSDDFAYVADETGLQVVDWTNVSQPSLAGTLDLTEKPRGLAAREGFVYAASGIAGLRVIDAADPLHPALVKDIPTTGKATGVAVFGERLTVVDGGAGLRFFNLADPRNPADIGQLPQTGLSGVVAADGSLVAAGFTDSATGRSAVLLVDAADAARPVVRGIIPTNGRPAAIDLSDGFAHVLSTEALLEIFDIRDPSHPQVPVAGGSQLDLGIGGRGVAAVGAFAYVTTNSGGLRVIDLRSLEALKEAGAFNPAVNSFDVAAGDATVYLADLEGLKIIDVSRPAEPGFAGEVAVPEVGFGVALSGMDLFLGTGNGFVHLFDVTDPKRPVGLAELEIGGQPVALKSQGGVIGIANIIDQGFRLLERKRNPDDLSPLFSSSSGSFAYALDLKDDRAYVLAARSFKGPSELQIFDISNPAATTPVASLPLSGLARGIAVSGGFAYVGIDRALTVVDLFDERAPRVVGSISTSSVIQDIAIDIDQEIAYVVLPDEGLKAFDLSDPIHPRETASLNLPGAPGRIAVKPPFAYVTGTEGGLFILQIQEIAQPAVPAGDPSEDPLGDSKPGDAGGVTGGPFVNGPRASSAGGCQLEVSSPGPESGEILFAVGGVVIFAWRFFRVGSKK